MRSVEARIRALEAKNRVAVRAAADRDYNPIVIFDPDNPPPGMWDDYRPAGANATGQNEGGRPWPD